MPKAKVLNFLTLIYVPAVHCLYCTVAVRWAGARFNQEVTNQMTTVLLDGRGLFQQIHAACHIAKNVQEFQEVHEFQRVLLASKTYWIKGLPTPTIIAMWESRLLNDNVQKPEMQNMCYVPQLYPGPKRDFNDQLLLNVAQKKEKLKRCVFTKFYKDKTS